MKLRFGFMWNCPWRLQWRKDFEFWSRTQVGPFYVLDYYRQLDGEE